MLEDFDVFRAQGSAQNGHGVVEAVLMGHDHVGVAFHHQGRAGFADRLPGKIQAIEQFAFGEKRRFGRIDVFGRRDRGHVGQHSPADSHWPGLGVADGKQQSAFEAVVIIAASGRFCQNSDWLRGFLPGRRFWLAFSFLPA